VLLSNARRLPRSARRDSRSLERPAKCVNCSPSPRPGLREYYGELHHLILQLDKPAAGFIPNPQDLQPLACFIQRASPEELRHERQAFWDALERFWAGAQANPQRLPLFRQQRCNRIRRSAAQLLPKRSDEGLTPWRSSASAARWTSSTPIAPSRYRASRPVNSGRSSMSRASSGALILRLVPYYILFRST
jgi:hypothetical protein